MRVLMLCGTPLWLLKHRLVVRWLRGCSKLGW
jgi:hypothetical protein